MLNMGNHITKSSPIRDVGGYTDFTKQEIEELTFRGFTKEELDVLMNETKNNSMHKKRKVMPISNNNHEKNV